MGRNKTRINVSLSHEDKKFITDKAEKMGFNSVSAFLIDASKSHFRFNVDMSVYRQLIREINYIGKNINSLVRRINSDGFYTEMDLDSIQIQQEKIVKLLNKDYKDLIGIRDNFSSDNLSLKEKKNLIRALEEHELGIPKRVVLNEVFEQLREDFNYIGHAIENSPSQEKDIADFFWECTYKKEIFEMDSQQVISLSNRIYLFTERLKMKLLNVEQSFSDHDWFELREIFTEYDI